MIHLLNYSAISLKDLTKYAVEFRYPGELANKDDARITLHTMKLVRLFVREKLRLK